jgi:GT2 family glycosyltransferase
VDGKFFRLGEKRFFAKGVAYGPFEHHAGPDQAGFASPEQTAKDFAQITQLGANLVRIYHIPPRWFLDLAAQHQLKVLLDVPWNQQICFLDSGQVRTDARNAVRRAAATCAGHPAVFALSVANEIPPDIVRWSGAGAIVDFIDELCGVAKQIDSELLCTFGNFPTTEFLRPQTVDFVCFNVYLHQERPFKSYLARLQMLTEGKPLLLGEFGIDSLRETEDRKCEMLGWQIETAFRGGLAGAVLFAFTDDWWKDGRLVEGWEMGLVTRERQPKPSFWEVQKKFNAAPYLPLTRYPKISVVVASFNGERTLKACLESLLLLNYPDYEVILVDDGSTDTTAKLAFLFPKVRYIRHEKNLGLSAARNTGIAAASGEIIAFTDSDCRADPDWLYYLATEFNSGDFVAVGGPNLPPPEDSPVAAAVMASPGGPAHVMLSDRQAEHIPGCNMAAQKWALLEVGGFDPVFRLAGDDVDICWRLQQDGFKIGFSPAALVWHYRRPTVGAYLSQQHGYGEAEAMLVRKHPENFNTFGGSIWRGRIYTSSKFGLLLRAPIIYRGPFGSAGFQALYSSQPASTLMLCTGLEYYALVALPLCVLSVVFHDLLPLAAASLLLPIAVCAAAGMQAEIPRNKRRFWSRPLVGLLFLLQPIARGWARYQHRVLRRGAGNAPEPSLDSVALRHSGELQLEINYKSDKTLDRFLVVKNILKGLEDKGWPHRADAGWTDYDVEIYDTRWCKLQLATVVEGQDMRTLRCRLRARWSLRAKAAFGLLCGLELLVLGFLAPERPWPWLLLLSLAVFAMWLRHQERNLQSIVATFLNDLAKSLKLESSRGTVPAAPSVPTKKQPEGPVLKS